MSYWEDMRAMVMPQWSCGYTVVLTSLRESFMGERGEKNGEEQERERQKKFNIRKTSQQIVFIFMKRLYGTLPNFTIKGKEDKPSDGLEI